MLVIRLDVAGETRIRWPHQDDEAVIALGKAYVRYEESLPPEQQILTPSLSFVNTLVQGADHAAQQVEAGESQRATSAEAFRQAYAKAKPLLNRAVLRLKGKYAGNLADLEQWGLDTALVRGQVSVRKPTSQAQWLHFLQRYVAKEQTLLLGERIIDPPFAEMSSLWRTIQSALQARNSAQDQREGGVYRRGVLCRQLLDTLQVAAAAIVVTQYKGRVDPALQRWGYDVYVPAPSPNEKSQKDPATNTKEKETSG